MNNQYPYYSNYNQRNYYPTVPVLNPPMNYQVTGPYYSQQTYVSPINYQPNLYLTQIDPYYQNQYSNGYYNNGLNGNGSIYHYGY